MSEYINDRDQMNAEALKKIIGIITDYTEENCPALAMTLPVARVVDEQVRILVEQSDTIPDAEVVTAACRMLYNAIGEPFLALVKLVHEEAREDMGYELGVLEVWRMLAGVTDDAVTTAKSTEALEAFMNWQEKVLWSPPGILGPNPEDVVYSIKITAKMARECWGWNEADIQQAIKYADEGIMKAGDGFDWDLEMLKAAVREDWDIMKITQAIEDKAHDFWADGEQSEQ